MKAKKSHKANLENRKKQFFQVGFILSLSLTLVAFEWSDGSFSPLSSEVEIASELPTEIISIQEFDFSKPKISKPYRERTTVIDSIIMIDDLLVAKDNSDKVFEDIDVSEIEDFDKDTILIEPISKKKKETKTLGSGFMPVDGYIPHYKSCADLSAKEMVECVNDAFRSNLQSEIETPESLSFTGGKLVIATFTVDEHGKVSEIFIHKEDKYEQDLVDEVKRALFAMPKMIPGSQGNQPIRVQFTLPINISIH